MGLAYARPFMEETMTKQTTFKTSKQDTFKAGLELKEAEVHVLTVHFYALAEMLAKKNPVDPKQFVSSYPRTWNAVMTDKPLSFDLPNEA